MWGEIKMTVFAGWQLSVIIATGSSYGSFFYPSTGNFVVDTIQQVSYDLNNKIEAKEETGNRLVIALVEGVFGVGGTLERYWTGSGTSELGRFANDTPQAYSFSSIPYYGIMIQPNGFGSGNPYIILADVKFDSQRIGHRPGSNLMTESLGFLARYVITGSILPD